MIECLVTGAGGFVGSAVVDRLRRAPGLHVRAAMRERPAALPPTDVALHLGGDLHVPASWDEALEGVDCVVHAAARVHVMDDRAAQPLAVYRAVNVRGTVELAERAARAGARRFVFVSSIKVNGERTPAGRRFHAGDTPAPQDPYALSKCEAEESLRRLSARTGLEVVIVRPPLIHGPGVRANFRALVDAVARGVPLPFGRIANLRSLVGLHNLADLLTACATHPAAANQTFLVRDGEDLSTPELVRRIAAALGRPSRLVAVPVWLLRLGARAAGRSEQFSRVCDSLQVDDTPTRERLGWTPPLTVDTGLAAAVAELRSPQPPR